MKKLMITVSLISFFVFGNMPVIMAEDALTVEGVWEQVSTNTKAWETENGKRLAIIRAGDHYEVKWVEGETTAAYFGDGIRIALSRLEHLCEPDDRHGAGSDLPDSVCQEVKDQQVVINVSYALSNDGNFLTKMQDGRWVYWDDNQRFTHYEVKPNFYTTTLKRISGPAKAETPAVAQVESRGEFYFLTKDGRKVTGEEASKVPLEEGTKLVTGKDGHIKMTLPDNTTFTVGPGSDIVIDEFVYDPDNSPKKVVASMTIGVFRWVTGNVFGDATVHKDPAQMKVKLPVVAVGIRGTDFEATVQPDGSGSVVLNFGQLEITENKTGFTFIMNAGEKIIFGADGSVSRPMKVS